MGVIEAAASIQHLVRRELLEETADTAAAAADDAERVQASGEARDGLGDVGIVVAHATVEDGAELFAA